MATIGRSFDILDKKIKQYNSSLKASQNELKKLDKELELDPGNIDAIRLKYEKLEKNIQDLQLKNSVLIQKQEALNKDFEAGAISNSVYQRQLLKTNVDLEKVELQTKQTTIALALKNAELKKANFTNFTKGLDKVAAGAEKVSRTVSVATAAIVAYVYASIKVADVLTDDANKFDTTVEALQLQRYAYDRVTGSAESYEKTLQSLGSMMSSIASGRGAKYLYYLKQLGIEEDNLKGKTSGKQYEIIFESLKKVTDEALRTEIALGLFGDTGRDVANMASATSEELDKLYDELKANGLITAEQSELAGEYVDKLDLLKRRLIETAVDILGWWDSLGKTGQMLIVTLLGLIIVLPKLVLGIKTVSTAIQVMQMTTAPTILIFAAIASAVLLLIGVFQQLRKETNETTESLNEMLKEVNAVGGDLNASLNTNNNVISESNSTRKIDANVDVNVRGNTAIDNETANNIGNSLGSQLNSDILNYELGKLVK